LFAWLAPLFFIVVAGLFWKRSSAAALTVVLCSWLINCAWSIAPIKQSIAALIPALGPLENAHISAVAAFVITLLTFSAVRQGEPALFSQAAQAEMGGVTS
jgi:SSS family solute:Na+ symporter